MSMTKMIQIQCPVCRHQFDYEIWETLNVELDPEASEKLKQGKFFQVRCPSCQETLRPVYPMLYHDPANKAMVYFRPEATDEEIHECIKGHQDVLKKMADFIPPERLQEVAPRLRVVTTVIELCEKAHIFGAGLDDRSIEFAKCLMIEEAYKREPQRKVKYALFEFEGRARMVFFDENRQFVNKIELKDEVLEALNDTLKDLPENEAIINAQWIKRLRAQE